MARAFNVDAARSSFELPAHTRIQIAALMDDMDMDARDVVIRAVAELWQREIGEAPRDVYSELDQLKNAIEEMKASLH